MARVKSPSHILKKIYNRVSVSPFVVKLFPAMLVMQEPKRMIALNLQTGSWVMCI